MQKFDLSLWLQDKSRKVVTRDGREATIVCTDADEKYPVVAKMNGWDCVFVELFDKNGRHKGEQEDTIFDLFFADEEEELTEFEKSVQYVLGCYACKQIELGDKADNIKLYAETLLDLARKEIEKENSEFKPKFTYNEKDYSKLANKLIEFRNNTPLCSVSYRDGEGRKVILHYEKEILDLVKKEIEKSIEDGAIEFAKSYMEDVNPSFEKVQESEELWKWKMSCLRSINKAYTQGKQDALKDLPKWKKATEDKEFDRCVLLLEDDKVVIATCVFKDEYYIELNDLRTLPKEE